jgi:hypothetical protein
LLLLLLLLRLLLEAVTDVSMFHQVVAHKQ